ncbi:Interferon alpha-13 [Sciurus carolinensis]|uniref:Interferon alpha-13 n=1 Tax=Sciurus carolinensis TaxID=30640 RepID=A0AA41MZ03_SCICA|nr:Interferon alpha-13 [Sciurus carolinensis]
MGPNQGLQRTRGKGPRSPTSGSPAASAQTSKALPLAFLLSLVVLSYKSTCSLGCDLPQIYNLGLETPERNEEGALMLLEKMRRVPTLSCLNYRKDFAFPQEQMDGEQVQKAQAVSILHEMTQQVFNLFSTQESFAAWDKTLLDTFLTGLYQQLDDLKACVTQQIVTIKILDQHFGGPTPTVGNSCWQQFTFQCKL